MPWEWMVSTHRPCTYMLPSAYTKAQMNEAVYPCLWCKQTSKNINSASLPSYRPRRATARAHQLRGQQCHRTRRL